MQSQVKNTFRDQQIVVDSTTSYISCTFTSCNIVYMGGDFVLIDCKFDSCQFTIAGEAGKTLGFMQAVGMIQQQIPPQLPLAVGQLPEGGRLH